MNCSTQGFPVLHYLLEFAQTQVHWVGDVIQPFHLLSPPSPLNQDLVLIGSVQFSSVAQSCLILCDPMNRSMPGLPVHHQLWEFTQTHVNQVSESDESSSRWHQWYHPAISSSVVPFSSCPQSLPAAESFSMSQLLAWGGQSTGVGGYLYIKMLVFTEHHFYKFSIYSFIQ